MFEYTSALLKAYRPAKHAYDYLMGLTNKDSLTLKPGDLSKSIQSTMPDTVFFVSTAGEWNNATKTIVSNLGALFSSVDQVDLYINTLADSIKARLSAVRQTLRDIESNLVSISRARRVDTDEEVYISPSNMIVVDPNPELYIDAPPLKVDYETGYIQIEDTGSVSMVRAAGGFAGRVEVERSLGLMESTGSPQDMVDGNRFTFWMGTYYSDAPIRSTSTSIPWLPQKYKHGFAVILTAFLDRPTTVSEIYIDPVSTSPFKVVGVTWTPQGIESVLQCGNFECSDGWTLEGSALIDSSGGLDGSASLVIPLSVGHASQTVAVTATVGTRVELFYSMRGTGDMEAGARLIWVDGAGNVISHKEQTNLPAGFFVPYRIVDFVPALAASAIVELGVFENPNLPGSAVFDEASLYIGENVWFPEETVNGPTTIFLPDTITSKRISLILAQENPRREILVKDGRKLQGTINPARGIRGISPALINTIDEFINVVEEDNKKEVLAYRVGIRELDFRYRQFSSRGRFVTQQVRTKGEIRRFWFEVDVPTILGGRVDFHIYTGGIVDVENRISVSPFFVRSGQEGRVVEVYTSEELDAGWVPSQTNSQIVLLDPKTVTEVFDGTDMDGKITLSKPVHVREVRIEDAQNWLNVYSAFPESFDPNAAVLYGFADESDRDAVRKGDIISGSIDVITSKRGYIPIKVTVSTDRWTAEQDIYGRPDKSQVFFVRGERLTLTQREEIETGESSDVISFEGWLAETTLGDLKRLAPRSMLSRITSFLESAGKFRRIRNPNFNFNDQSSLKEVLDVGIFFGVSKIFVLRHLKQVYYHLKFAGKLSKSSSLKKTAITGVSVSNVYKTKYRPIVSGRDGAAIRLWFVDPDTGNSVPISSGRFRVLSPSMGTIEILGTPPASSYTEVYADYVHAQRGGNESDSFSKVGGYVLPASGMTEQFGDFAVASRSYPVTRNMTDYDTGRIPELRPPDFDPLSDSYYPVIEYYVTSDGEVVFSRDFFKYGDIPATITVTYETLDFQPRIGVEVTRAGNPSYSPRLRMVKFKMKTKTQKFRST